MRRIRRLTRQLNRIRSSLPSLETDPDSEVELPEFVYGADLRFQGELDAEKAIERGIIVFIPKWGEGDSEVSTFDSYTRKVIRAGGIITWYHFPTFGAKSGGGYPDGYDPVIDGANEANAFLEGVEPLSPDLPLMPDIEKETVDISPKAARAWMGAYCDVVCPESPHNRLLLYTSDRKLREIFGPYEDAPEFYTWLVGFCDLLLPRYGLNEPGDAAPDWQFEPPVPKPWADVGKTWVGWQFSSKWDADAPAGKKPGEVDGIEKEADMILFRTSWLEQFVPRNELAALVARSKG